MKLDDLCVLVAMAPSGVQLIADSAVPLVPICMACAGKLAAGLERLELARPTAAQLREMAQHDSQWRPKD